MIFRVGALLHCRFSVFALALLRILIVKKENKKINGKSLCSNVVAFILIFASLGF